MQFGLTLQPLPSKAKCRQCQVDSKQERRQKSGSEAQVGGAAGTGARLRARRQLAVLGAARVSKEKERTKKQVIGLASSKPLVYQTREEWGWGGPLSFQNPYSLSICLKVTGKHFRGRHGSELDLPW